MANKLLFLLLFSVFSLFPKFALASDFHSFPENNRPNSTVCTAPPPDRFRVTSKSTNEISLAWESIWPGASQSLDVFLKNPSGGWDTVFASLLVSGESFTVVNLLPNSIYRFAIATKCEDGSTGILQSIFTDGTLIIELTINGRTPLNPVGINCTSIPKNAPWKGFEISGPSKEGYITSIFQLDYCNDISASPLPQPCIKRVEHDNPIVATDENGSWPNFGQPILGTQSPFRIGLRNGTIMNTSTVGWVTLSSTPTHIVLCPVYNHSEDPWNMSYNFSAIVAQQSSLHQKNEDQRSSSDMLETDKVIPSNPFTETLTIFLPERLCNRNNLNFAVFNANGGLVVEKYVENNEISTANIPTQDLAPGLYLLMIKSPTRIETVKIIKQ